MKTVVMSTIYPAARAFLPDLFDSCAAQTDRDFSLLLMDDGAGDLSAFVSRAPGLRVHAVPAQGTPAQVRAQGIRWARQNGFEAILCADADDWFSPERVQVTKQMLAGSPVLVNQLILATSREQILQPLWPGRLQEGAEITSAVLQDGNCMGFSNTALRLSVFTEEDFGFPGDIVALDWLLFFRIVNRGNRAVFTRRFSTFYRQYSENVAGLLHIDEAALERGMEVKKRHYECLAGQGFAAQARSYDQILRKLRDDSSFAKSYYAKLLRSPVKEPLWWESSRLLTKMEDF
jgi:glycosyltransferase involved in cell wall biosynthesis